MKKALFIIFILFSYSLPFGFTATDEGYGEDQEALGQFVDSFENLNNVSVQVLVERNATLNAMELNYTAGGVYLYENLTAYTEFEEAGDRIIHYGDYNVSLDFIRNVDSRLYEDYGAGFFDEFEYDFEMRFNTTIADTAKIWFMLSNFTTNAYTQAVNTRRYLSIVMTQYAVPGQVVDVIEGREDGVQNFETSGDLAISTWYYNTFKLNQTYWELDIYSDSARTALVETVSVELDEAKGVYRYLLMSSLDSNHVQRMMGNIRNIWLGNTSSGYETDGYFTTDDYMNDTVCNGTALALMVNTSIPGNTDIQVQFSNDNATWGDWEGTPLDSNILSGGFETIDLRYLNETDVYLRFNLSTTDILITPRVYQARIISTIGNSTGAGAAPGTSGSGAIGFIILSLICTPLVLLLWGRRRR